jgi:hypothetical protein
MLSLSSVSLIHWHISSQALHHGNFSECTLMFASVAPYRRPIGDGMAPSTRHLSFTQT